MLEVNLLGILAELFDDEVVSVEHFNPVSILRTFQVYFHSVHKDRTRD